MEILNQSSTMERNLLCFSAQMGPNFLPPKCTHENKRKLWKPVHCAIPLPTHHVPQNKTALLHLTAACGKTFLLSLLRHSSRLKNAMFLFCFPGVADSCSPLLRAHVRGGAEEVMLWARGSGCRNCPGQGARPAPSSPGTHPFQDTSSVDGAAAPCTWFSSARDTGSQQG